MPACLNIDLISAIVFPGKIYTGLSESVLFRSYKDFDLALLPRSFWDKEKFFLLHIHGENGIDISVNIGTGSGNSEHNAISFKFSERHLHEGVITLDKLYDDENLNHRQRRAQAENELDIPELLRSQ